MSAGIEVTPDAGVVRVSSHSPPPYHQTRHTVMAAYRVVKQPPRTPGLAH